MNFSLSDIFNSQNKLADYYKKFNVSERLLFTGHSHQAWPDCAFEAQKQAWEDAALLIDDKWEKAFAKAEEVKRGYQKLLNDNSGFITLASNTHELLIRFLSALPLKQKPKLITTDGEFHTIRRQLDRLTEEKIEIVKVDSKSPNVVELLMNKCDDRTAAVILSAVFFQSGVILPNLSELADFCKSKNIYLLVDAYHALNVIPFSIKEHRLESAFIIGGGYKYCQLGEGNCFLRFPKDCELRPVITGWFSEFTALAHKKNSNEVIYGSGGDLFAGATYDPTSNYRAAEVFSFFEKMNLTPGFLREVSQHQINLLAGKFDELNLNERIISRNKNIDLKNIAGFLVFTSKRASDICTGLNQRGVLTDFRGNSLRFGPAPYISDDQIQQAIKLLGEVVNSL
ncbi:MAG: aminotransferase class V-fold PLP-dependent enzyme [Ignavibacteriales bacterium]|nr:aminotransferase class V-fold PLP-dependent enzyme [Ignavibacteriales bacterium]